MAEKRSEAQLAFDMAAHGWAFCNQPMLEGKVIQLERLAQNLAMSDKRHERLRIIISHLHKKSLVQP